MCPLDSQEQINFKLGSLGHFNKVCSLIMIEYEEKILTILSATLGLLLVISEVLAWSKCPWNSITEILLLRKNPCFREQNPEIESQ